MRKLRVALAVHGRLHAFHLCRELQRVGVEATLLTNYPTAAVEKFGIEGSRVHGYTPHGVGSRLLARFLPASDGMESFSHRWFGRWAARTLAAEPWDAIYIFSGVAEESLDALRGTPTIRVLARGSSHVRTQARILEEEELRAGRPVERPSAWRIARETREYEKADAIVTLSSFARQSFLDEGTSPEKVWLLPSGVEIERFRATKDTLAARLERIRAGSPLRVLTVGTLSLRKGILDHFELVKQLSPRMSFRFVGTIDPQIADLVRATPALELRPRVHEHELPAEYAWADVFLFPSLEEGFPAVLAQARAAAVPLLATPNSSAPQLIDEGRTGFLVPIRNPEAMAGCLVRWDQDRELLASMVSLVAALPDLRGWKDMASDFINYVELAKDRRSSAG